MSAGSGVNRSTIRPCVLAGPSHARAAPLSLCRDVDFCTRREYECVGITPWLARPPKMASRRLKRALRLLYVEHIHVKNK
jgi:hypothetical protein